MVKSGFKLEQVLFEHINQDGSLSIFIMHIWTWHLLFQELVGEKIKTQQLSNDLEKLATELDKIGIDKEKLLQEELQSDERSV